MPKRPRQPLHWSKKLLFSLVTTVVVLGSIELALRVVGVQPVTDTRDPFVGFSQQVPLMELVRDEAGNAFMKTAKSKLVWFNDQSFPKRKENGVRRIFALGGSTTYGHPYDDTTSFSGWMREYLPVADASQRWEVINCGGISYASYRVAALMEELVQYEPDLFVVFSAHNEFLERRTYAGMFERSAASLQIRAALSRTRTFALADRLLHREPARPGNFLPAEVDEVLNHTIGPTDYHRDLKWRSQVLAHYELNLRRMVEIANRANCRIVFVTPASNESDCSPFKSEFGSQVTEAQQAEVLNLLSQAESEVNNNEIERANLRLTKAKEIAPEFAETRYRLGKLLMRARKFDLAQIELKAALNEDICPLRAVDAITTSIWHVSEELHVPVVDFEKRLRDLCQQDRGHPILGEAYFLDHVHPTIGVNRKLALWIIDELEQAKIFDCTDLKRPEVQDELETATERVMNRIDQRAHGVALRNLAKVLHWSGKFAEAAPRATDALELLVDDPESRYVLADCLHHMGNSQAALAQYELLFSGPQDWGKAYLPYADLLAQRGEFARAKPYLILALVVDPANAYTHYLLGRTHLELGEFKFAVESLTEANRIYPNEPTTLTLLKEAQRKLAGS
jgi:tetratricopeptide (TPR) repeat protein